MYSRGCIYMWWFIILRVMFSPASPGIYSRNNTSTSGKISPEKSKSISIFSRKTSKSQALAVTVEKLQSEIDGLKIIVNALNRNITELKSGLSNQKSFAESLASSIDQEGARVRSISPSSPSTPHRHDDERRHKERRDGQERRVTYERRAKEEKCCYFL